ncbi:MAG: PP2C family protein-serine/threonine phosphatase [Treponema sp.]|nr:PP2C family protein-serine/threonine phosphatase [Treponema sp.]
MKGKAFKWGINQKSLMSIIVFAILTNAFVCLGGSLIFDRAVQKIYNERGYAVSNIILKQIDHDKIAQYVRTWEADEYYDKMSDYLIDIQVSSNAAYIYIAVPYEDRTMKYVYDSGSNIGFVDPIVASFDEIWNAYKTGERPESYLVRHSQYGYLTSSCLPIKDSTGKVVALLFVDTNMKVITSTIHRFILNMSLIALILLVLFSQLNYRYVHKNLIDPLLLIRKNIQAFTSRTYTDDESLGKIKTNDEIQELAQAIDTMEKNTLGYIEDIKAITAEKERISADLTVAAKIQSDMLNKDYPPFPKRKDFDLFATMSPAKEVGGDLYDYLLLDEDHLMMTVGDVSGKGVPAALFMGKCKVLLDLYALLGLSPKEIFDRANNHLCKGNDSGLFVTCWLGILCFSTGELRFVNAGHPYPVLFQNGEFSYLRTKPNFILGGMEDFSYEEHSVTLSKGDCIFIYSDGVTEATNSKNELFGESRLLQEIKKTESLSAPDTLKEMRKKIDFFAGNSEQADDITMLDFVWNSAKIGETKSYVQ